MRTWYLSISIVLLFYSCTGKETCDRVKEMPSTTAHKADISRIIKNPDVKSLLDRYKDRLQVFGIYEYTYNQQTSTSVYCNKYYKGLQLLRDRYDISLKNNSIISASGDLPPDTIPLNLRPTVMVNEAVRLARPRLENRTENCIGFQLAIRNITLNRDSTPEYRLVWLIQDSRDGSPNIMIDAHSGEQL